LEAVHLLKIHFKNDIYIRGNCDQAPFSLASILRTPQKWLMDLYEHENLIIQLLEYCTDVTCQFIGLMAQTRADMLSNGDSPAGPELISPELYKKYALPYEKMVVNYAHKFGKKYTIHICGDTSAILEDILETDTDAVELDHKTDILRAHDLYKDKVVFIGNIDPSGILARGTIEEVQNKTERLLQIYDDSPRFILNAGCAIPAFTPQENLRAMITTARTFFG
jgi:uroporphyrinogen decarboxylase